MPLIALAGLPGTGKSALARALSAALDAPVFDKDVVRAALYAPDRIEYSREQDDLCWELTLRAAGLELARRQPPGRERAGPGKATPTEFPQCGNFVGPAREAPGPESCVILDGRTYSRAGQVQALRDQAARAGLPLLLVECVCSEGVARARLAADLAAGRHLAANRTPELHRRLAEAADPIAPPKLVIDTERLALGAQVAAVVEGLAAMRPDPRPR